MRNLTGTVAPCGLVCGLCRNATPEKGSCPGCKDGGGPDDCYQRTCCTTRELEGCWQCGDFPCDRGFFAKSNEEWRGLCVGSIECIREYGIETYLDRMVSRIGEVVEYGDFRFKTPEEIREAFCGAQS